MQTGIPPAAMIISLGVYSQKIPTTFLPDFLAFCAYSRQLPTILSKYDKAPELVGSFLLSQHGFIVLAWQGSWLHGDSVFLIALIRSEQEVTARLSGSTELAEVARAEAFLEHLSFPIPNFLQI
jgi:hypothetical protein